MTPQPWTCPRCNKVKAPHVDECGCVGAFKLEPWAPTDTPTHVPSLWPDCGCPPGRCERTVCPHRSVLFPSVFITSGTVPLKQELSWWRDAAATSFRNFEESLDAEPKG